MISLMNGIRQSILFIVVNVTINEIVKVAYSKSVNEKINFTGKCSCEIVLMGRYCKMKIFPCKYYIYTCIYTDINNRRYLKQNLKHLCKLYCN